MGRLGDKKSGGGNHTKVAERNKNRLKRKKAGISE